MTAILSSVHELAASIGSGTTLAVPRDQSGCAMEVVRALVRRPVRDLRLIAVPQAGLQADLLIGAGCLASVEAAAVTLGEYGAAPRFRAAVSAGAIEIRDSTCPAIHAGFQAAEKGVPFMPLRGILGSDLEVHRDDWRTIENPYGDADPILLLPAISPDISLFHAARADQEGNVWIGVNRELLTMAHASDRTFVTVEAFSDENLLADEHLAAGTIPSLYVTAVAQAAQGAAPVGLAGHYDEDGAHLRRYAELAQTEEGFVRYVAEHVLDEPAVA